MNLFKWYEEIGCHSPLQYYRPRIARKDLVAFYTPTFFPGTSHVAMRAYCMFDDLCEAETACSQCMVDFVKVHFFVIYPNLLQVLLR